MEVGIFQLVRRHTYRKGQKMQDRREYKRKWREQYDIGATDKGRDATRLSRLSEDQLILLQSKLPNMIVNTRGLDVADEHYYCYDGTGPQTADGYPRAFRLPVRARRPDEAFGWSTNFRPSQVVLACNGEFAETPSDEASHLCGNPRCLRSSHLIWEAPKANQNRKGCPGLIRTGNGQQLTICEHNPTCMIINYRPDALAPPRMKQ